MEQPHDQDVSGEELVRLCRERLPGDPRPFRALVARYRDQVINTAYRFLGNPRDAEDVAEDMNLVFRQLAQVCCPNAKVALVVANARFHGELIPVDLILSELAGDAGFQTEKIYVTRYKGNSSQQMGKFGRVAVRESVALFGPAN